MPGKERKIILPHYLFGNKIFQSCLKTEATNYMITNYNCDKKLNNRFRALETDTITIWNKHWFEVFNSKDALFTGRILNGCYYTSLNNRLSYQSVASILKHAFWIQTELNISYIFLIQHQHTYLFERSLFFTHTNMHTYSKHTEDKCWTHRLWWIWLYDRHMWKVW